MNIYEIINPSDRATLRAPNILIAGLAVMLLAEGRYGANGPDGKCPVMFGWAEWLFDQGITMEGVPDTIEKHKPEIAAALASVLLGSPEDRPAVEAALAARPDYHTRAAYIENRNNKLRSSTNDFESRAHAIAKALVK